MESQGYMGGSGIELHQSPRIGLLWERIQAGLPCSWADGNSFLSLYRELKKRWQNI